MFKRRLYQAIGGVLLGGWVAFVIAADAPEPNDPWDGLTPLGAVQAGSSDGRIPEWQGGLTPENSPAHEAGSHYVDPYADDKPIVTVTHANRETYEAWLTPGLQALLTRYADTFALPVYPTRRSAAAPEWVYHALRDNARNAKLTADGNGVSGAGVASAFPIPVDSDNRVDARKVLWNHLTRWRGQALERRVSAGLVHGEGKAVLATTHERILCIYCQRRAEDRTPANRLLHYLSEVVSPARMAGSALLMHDTLNRVSEPRKLWGYTAGQQRVRRAPGFDYDAPFPAADNMLTADELDMFNGALDRYEWQFLGKQEKLIPYNNYRIGEQGIAYDELLKTGHINPAYTRFERHRVWVIEGRLKEGARHPYHRRTLYLDEDSWAIVLAELYNSHDELWHVNMAFVQNFYDVPVVASTLDVYHDLSAQRYFVALLNSEESSGFTYSSDQLPASLFTPEGLRRRGGR